LPALLNRDYRDLFAEFNARDVDFLIVGAFTLAGTIVQLGVAPTRIDLLTRVAGLDFEEAWTRRIEAAYGDQRVFVVSRADLIASKRAAARPQDLADLSALDDAEADEEV
jgi:hypothetical protein